MTNLMHGQVLAEIPKLLWLTLLSICIHPNGWDHYLLLTKHWPSGRDSANCMWIMHVDTRRAIINSVLYMYMCSFFFSKILASKRETVAENETITLARENKISWCIVIAVDVCNTRGHSVSCKMQRKSCKSHLCCFFSHRDIQCRK